MTISANDFRSGQQSDDPIERLRPNQLLALKVLLAGGTVLKAADAADVHRTRVSEWKNGDPNFIAALNREKRRLVEQARHRLLNLTGSAIDNVARSIVEDGNVRDSRWLLEKVGLTSPEAIAPGHTNPDVIWLIQRFRAWLLDEISNAADGTGDVAEEELFEALGDERVETADRDFETQQQIELKRKFQKLFRQFPSDDLPDLNRDDERPDRDDGGGEAADE